MAKKEKVTSLRIDEGLWKEVKLHAIERDTTLSKLVERLLREGIARDKKSKSTSD